MWWKELLKFIVPLIVQEWAERRAEKKAREAAEKQEKKK